MPTKIVLNHKAVGDYLMSDSVAALMEEYAERIRAKLPKQGYRVKNYAWTKRYRIRRRVSSVAATHKRAIQQNQKNNTILKAVGEVKE